MIRILLLVHRYLGIGLGAMMLLWCLSGFVMMYVQYPEVTQQQKIANLAPLNLQRCCQLPTIDANITAAQVQMMAGTPVLYLATDQGLRLVDLTSGHWITEVSVAQSTRISESFLRENNLLGRFRYTGEVDLDQWTLGSEFDRHRPLQHFALEGDSGLEWYISSLTGEVVQTTTAQQRLWNYFGSVIHWLYPTIVRQYPAAWSQIVIILSLLGTFLTATGLYIGIRPFRLRKNGRRSPYRHTALWHHYTGLVFGLFTLTWIVSGLLSMHPWGLLQSSHRAEAAPFDHPIPTAQVNAFIKRLPEQTFGADLRQLQLRNNHSELVAYALSSDGSRQRLSAETLTPIELTEAALHERALRLQPNTSIARADLLHTADHYYYNHHNSRPFPVYRVIFDDQESTRYYLDMVTGNPLLRVDSAGRWHRWLFNGLHRGDFFHWLRLRPRWDLIMLTLLSGVTAVCATGTYMGFRRLTRKRKPRAIGLQKAN